MEFKIAWWNTRLSPNGGGISAEQGSRVAAALASIVANDVDAVILGEVSPEAVELLKPIFPDEVFAFESLDGRDGQLKFGMATLYRRDRLVMGAPLFQIAMIGVQRSRVAVELHVRLIDGTLITIFAVHWPSRRYENAETERRSHIAQALRRQIDEKIAADPDALILVLGDFNDEPFDLAITKYLAATRDLQRVQRTPRLLYNPCWRNLLPVAGYAANVSPGPVGGTYYYKSGQVDRWHVFDQIIVSSTFVGGSSWHLNEERSTILDSRAGLIDNLATNPHFDHYPILAVFERSNDEPVQ